MEHIVLLGDSILDNDTYVPPGQPGVCAQFEDALRGRKGWKVTKLAKDGARMAHVLQVQLNHVPADATVLLLSIGGNDGLAAFKTLQTSFWSTATAFYHTFQLQYEALVDHIRNSVNFPLVLCTVYQAQLGGRGYVVDTVASLGVRFMNRAIRAVAAARKIPILDLWAIFSRREDYANQIEPGVPGGHKIVRNMLAMLDRNEHNDGCPWVYADATYDPAFAATIQDVSWFDSARFSRNGRALARASATNVANQ